MTVWSGSKRIDDDRIVVMQHDDEDGGWRLQFRWGQKDTVICLSEAAMAAVVEGYYSMRSHHGTREGAR